MGLMDLNIVNQKTDTRLILSGGTEIFCQFSGRFTDYIAIQIKDSSVNISQDNIKSIQFYIDHYIYNCNVTVLSIKHMPMIDIILLSLPELFHKDDRRKYYRLPYSMDVSVFPLTINEVYSSLADIPKHIFTRTKKLQTIDISGGGLKLSTTKHFNVEKQMIVTISEPEEVSILCNVKETTYNENGTIQYFQLEYVGISEEDRQKIVEFITSKLQA